MPGIVTCQRFQLCLADSSLLFLCKLGPCGLTCETHYQSNHAERPRSMHQSNMYQCHATQSSVMSIESLLCVMWSDIMQFFYLKKNTTITLNLFDSTPTRDITNRVSDTGTACSECLILLFDIVNQDGWMDGSWLFSHILTYWNCHGARSYYM